MPPRRTRNSKREMFVSVADVKATLDEVPSLKVKSVKTYMGHLKLFMREMKDDNVNTLLNDYEKTDEYIQNKKAERSGNPITLETKRTYYVTLNSVSLHVDFVKKQAKDFWQKRQDEYNRLAHEERAKNKVLKKHKGDPPKWSDLKDLASQFTNGAKYGVNHLIVALYTLIPPRRGEYRTLMYLDKKPEAENAAVRPRKSTNELRDSNKVPWNYVYPNEEGGTYTMVLRDFKTNQTYDTYEKVLPEDLSAIIKGFIDKQKIESNSVMFHTNRERKERGEPWVPLKDGNWSNKVTSAFKVKYDKHSIAIDELRHAFINSLKLNDMTTAEKETIALDMAHSTRFQDLYRQYITDEEPANDEPPPADNTEPDATLEQLYAMLGKAYMEARKIEALIVQKLNQSS